MPAGEEVPTVATDDDEQLVRRARAGDRPAFDALVRRTQDATYSLALRLTGNEDDARDVVQESYLRAYRGLQRFRGDARFTTWLYRITANTAASYRLRRSRHRHETLDDHGADMADGADSDPAWRVDVGWLRGRIAEALETLPDKLRSVVVMRDVHGLAHKSIAEELGITETAAKVRLHRARHRLRSQLRDAAPPGPRPPSPGDELDRRAG